MKYIKYLAVAVAASFLVAGCNLNEVPKFDDKDAFVAFLSSNASVNETGVLLKIPVMLASKSGVETDVFYTVTDGTAEQGVHFNVVGDGTLSFDEANATDTISVEVVDNGVFEGDITFSIAITDAGDVNLGRSKAITVKIVDDEHPLALILGDYTAKGTSYFNGAEEWTINIAKDASDLNKVWLSNFVQSGSNMAVYGVVNAEKTEMRIPVGQDISDAYPAVLLEGYYGPDGATEIPIGGFITVTINEDGSMAILDEFGSRVYNAAGASLGWFNIYAADVVLTRPL